MQLTPIYGWRRPEPGTKPPDVPYWLELGLEDVEATMKRVDDAATLHGAKWLGAAVMGAVSVPAGGGTLGLCTTSINVAAVAWPRLILVSLNVTSSAQTTFATYTTRIGGTNGPSVRGATPQHSVSVDYWDAVPANTARSYDATVQSSAAVTVYGSPTSTLQAIAFPA